MEGARASNAKLRSERERLVDMLTSQMEENEAMLDKMDGARAELQHSNDATRDEIKVLRNQVSCRCRRGGLSSPPAPPTSLTPPTSSTRTTKRARRARPSRRRGPSSASSPRRPPREGRRGRPRGSAR